MAEATETTLNEDPGIEGLYDKIMTGESDSSPDEEVVSTEQESTRAAADTGVETLPAEEEPPEVTEGQMIPKARLDAVIAERNALREQLPELEVFRKLYADTHPQPEPAVPSGETDASFLPVDFQPQTDEEAALAQAVRQLEAYVKRTSATVEEVQQRNMQAIVQQTQQRFDGVVNKAQTKAGIELSADERADMLSYAETIANRHPEMQFEEVVIRAFKFVADDRIRETASVRANKAATSAGRTKAMGNPPTSGSVREELTAEEALDRAYRESYGQA